MFLGKGVLKIAANLLKTYKQIYCNFIEITLWHGCSPVNLRHIFRTPFTKNNSGRLLPNLVPSASFDIKGRQETIFLKLHWGRGCCFGMKKLKELLHIFLYIGISLFLYIFIKFLEVLVDFSSKVPLSGFIWKYPTKQKHIQ